MDIDTPQVSREKIAEVNSFMRFFCSVVLALVVTFPAQSLALQLGPISRQHVAEGYIYTVPVYVEMDGYSTFQGNVFASDEFLAQTTIKMEKDYEGDAQLAIYTDWHLNEEDIEVEVHYQGRETRENYLLPGTGITAAPRIPSTCYRQWILRGTMLGNIVRILQTCGHELGSWPHSSNKDYTDYKIDQSIPLPNPGGLQEVLDYVAENYGFIGKPSSNLASRVINFREVSK